MLTLLRRRAGADADAGTTLIELMVAMSLATLIGALALTWFLGGSRADSQAVDLNVTTAGARNALQQWSSLIGVAAAANVNGVTVSGVTAISATSVSFTANLLNRPTCSIGTCSTTTGTPVTLAAVASTLNGVATKKLTQTIGTAPDTLVPSGVGYGSCLFTPYTAAGVALDCTKITTVAALNSIARINIDFTISGTQGASSTFTTSATVGGGVR